MEYKDYYQILGVARDADAGAIKSAYRKMARKYHPDVSKEANAEDRFKDLQEAYEVLKDPEKRRAYDQLGSNWRAGQDFRPPPGWENFAGGFAGGHAGSAGGPDIGGFSDFFEELFAQQRGRRGAHGGAPFRTRGEDSEAEIQIPLEDVLHGAKREISLEVPVHGPDGRMYRERRQLSVKIPAGIAEGQRLRMSGQGQPGQGGGPNGDLYLRVRYAPHPQFRAEGKDLYHDLPISPWEAVLGASVSVPTLDGQLRVKVPAGSSSGQKLRLGAKGLPAPKGDKAGDLYAVLQIVAPKQISEAEKALWERLAAESSFRPRNE
ncbi:DnaJ C-terminal domain-containing protein [Acidithiobacillus sp. IBUN Pt1247-S3]|uniref:DnaJ C-terminal domain-containing protein n=1 Tax=Acidithiobacillus sp. IBUN Pt1247-S3 TaxID=3166642 RepID=UPI0034E4358C